MILPGYRRGCTRMFLINPRACAQSEINGARWRVTESGDGQVFLSPDVIRDPHFYCEIHLETGLLVRIGPCFHMLPAALMLWLLATSLRYTLPRPPGALDVNTLWAAWHLVDHKSIVLCHWLALANHVVYNHDVYTLYKMIDIDAFDAANDYIGFMHLDPFFPNNFIVHF